MLQYKHSNMYNQSQLLFKHPTTTAANVTYTATGNHLHQGRRPRSDFILSASHQPLHSSTSLSSSHGGQSQASVCSRGIVTSRHLYAVIGCVPIQRCNHRLSHFFSRTWSGSIKAQPFQWFIASRQWKQSVGFQHSSTAFSQVLCRMRPRRDSSSSDKLFV